jgi:hypothetical protein
MNPMVRRLAVFSTAEVAGWAVARVIAETGERRKEGNGFLSGKAL